MAKSLMDCKNIDDVAKMERDHFDYKDFSILCDGYTVWLGEQKIGENPSQKIQIPKSIFDRLIRKYIAPQTKLGD